MTLKQKYALGEPVPNNPHAVVSNVPTLADVCAYEEHADYVVSAMKQGYPRFVQHYWVKQLIEWMVQHFELRVAYAVLLQKTPETKAFIDGFSGVIEFRSLSADEFGVALDLLYIENDDSKGASAIDQLKSFVQHTGCLISSRLAEKVLNNLGVLSTEYLSVGPKEAKAASEIAHQNIADISGVNSGDSVSITTSGMNAFYTAFKAMQSSQLKRGRSEWLQLGWVYLDSGNILQKYLTPEERLSVHYDILDTDAMIAKIKAMGKALSVVVLECPTNPFCQIADLKVIAECVHEQGGFLLTDPSIVSLYNIDCLSYSDIVVTSLTKYAGHSGDVMAGAIVLNEASTAYSELKAYVKEHALALYDLDMMALSKTLKSAKSQIQMMNENTRQLVDYLKQHPKVKKVFAVSESAHHQEYLKHNRAYGSIISIELEDHIKSFYDRIQLVKGPSFGADFTILCPYFYLAHYELVMDQTDSSLLKTLGIDRNLIRISVGCEPIEDLISEFSKALSEL